MGGNGENERRIVANRAALFLRGWLYTGTPVPLRATTACTSALMTLHVRELPALRLAYLRHTGDYGPALGDLWNALGRWCESRGLGAPQPGYLGLSHDDPACTPAGQCRYDACVPIGIGMRPGPDVQVQDFAGGPHACMRFQGVGADIGAAWKYLIKDLMPAQGLKPAPRAVVELYEADFAVDPDSGSFACWLCVPLLLPR
ncbi:hypothetical protein GCM10023090_29730 [Acidovorax lacteus]|uniref:AraC effector-binding domain-containing protein n=2 Tax=Acidovorax lacteus TaxID=1924988 RepID=A0ABP8LJG0_9BURK